MSRKNVLQMAYPFVVNDWNLSIFLLHAYHYPVPAGSVFVCLTLLFNNSIFLQQNLFWVSALTKETLWFNFFFYVRAYLGINSMKLKTNGIDHIVTADKYTPI